MNDRVQPVITRAEERAVESWADPARGSVLWHTLFSGDITATEDMCAGIAVLAPGGENPPHRHAEPEIYLILEGSGLLTIDGRESVVSKGAAVYIPGDAWHALHNTGEQELRLFYVFPKSRFSDIVYEFQPLMQASAVSRTSWEIEQPQPERPKPA